MVGARAGRAHASGDPPLRAVLEGVAGLALIVIDRYVDLDPAAGRAPAPGSTPRAARR